MPINTNVSLKDAGRKRALVLKLAELARARLEDAISCALVACDSDRAEFLQACCDEYTESVTRQVRLACSVALSVPKWEHAETGAAGDRVRPQEA
jgi:hypothetical protein